MEISFASRKLKKQLTDPISAIKHFGILARKINQRIQELASSENLEMIRKIPAAKCHELKGDRTGQFAVAISGNYRLIFVPLLENNESTQWSKITRIQIIKIEDYH